MFYIKDRFDFNYYTSAYQTYKVTLIVEIWFSSAMFISGFITTTMTSSLQQAS